MEENSQEENITTDAQYESAPIEECTRNCAVGDIEDDVPHLPNDIPFANTPTPVTNILVVPDYTGQYVIRDQFRPIAAALIEKYEELKHINPNSILFILNITGKGADKDRRKMAQIAAIPAKWTDILHQFTGGHFTYLMEFFYSNIQYLSREQYIALVYHELRHIGRDGKLMHHDIEEWSKMIGALGVDWTIRNGDEFPDLLADGTDWDALIGRRQLQMQIEEMRDPGLREIGKLTLVK